MRASYRARPSLPGAVAPQAGTATGGPEAPSKALDESARTIGRRLPAAAATR